MTLGNFTCDTDILKLKRVKCFFNTDAYDEKFSNTITDYNVIIDDGPHTLESMKTFITLYSKCIKLDGFLIIEDIQDIEWCQELTKLVPENFTTTVKDLRHVINRYDDIMLIMKRVY